MTFFFKRFCECLEGEVEVESDGFDGENSGMGEGRVEEMEEWWGERPQTESG